MLSGVLILSEIETWEICISDFGSFGEDSILLYI